MPTILGSGKQWWKRSETSLPEMFRLIKECRPTWVIGENECHIKLGLDTVISDLEKYSTRTFNISLGGVGFPPKTTNMDYFTPTNMDHIMGERQGSIRNGNSTTTDPNCKDVHTTQGNIRSSGNKFIKEDFEVYARSYPQPKMWHTPTAREHKNWQHNEMGSRVFKNSSKSYTSSNKIGKENWWGFEPRVGRVVDGIPDRVDRIKCLGNSVAQIPYLIGLSILWL